ncbi:MAG TPA: hypothetical protein VMW69_05875, partial [Spirochaetia bacterium]|nr:hypothetical protein [Spirochaetia bacterium]
LLCLPPVTGTASGQTVRVYFYRNGLSFQAVATGTDGAILGSLRVPSYSSVVAAAGHLNGRGVILCPFDSSGTASVLARADNYAYSY